MALSSPLGTGKRLAWVGLAIEILGIVDYSIIALTLAQVATRNVDQVALGFAIAAGVILLVLAGLTRATTVIAKDNGNLPAGKGYLAVEIIKFIALLFGGLTGLAFGILFLAAPGYVNDTEWARFLALSFALSTLFCALLWEALNIINPGVGALGGLHNRKLNWYEIGTYVFRMVGLVLLMTAVSVFLNSIRVDSTFPAPDTANPHPLTILDRIPPLGNPIGALFTAGLAVGTIALIATTVFSLAALLIDNVAKRGFINDKLFGGKIFSEFSVLISTLGVIFGSTLAIRSSASVLPNSTAAPTLTVFGALAAVASTLSGAINLYRFRSDVTDNYRRGVLALRTALSGITALVALIIAIWSITLVNNANSLRLFDQSALVVMGGLTVGACSFVVEMLNLLESQFLTEFKVAERIASVIKLLGFTLLLIALGVFYSHLLNCTTDTFAITGQPTQFPLQITTQNQTGTPAVVNVPVVPSTDIDTGGAAPTLGIRFCAIPVDDVFVGLHGGLNIAGIALGSLGSLIVVVIGFINLRAKLRDTSTRP